MNDIELAEKSVLLAIECGDEEGIEMTMEDVTLGNSNMFIIASMIKNNIDKEVLLKYLKTVDISIINPTLLKSWVNIACNSGCFTLIDWLINLPSSITGNVEEIFNFSNFLEVIKNKHEDMALKILSDICIFNDQLDSHNNSALNWARTNSMGNLEAALRKFRFVERLEELQKF